MKIFDYRNTPEGLLTPEIVRMLSSIHEHKGKQELFLEANIDELKKQRKLIMKHCRKVLWDGMNVKIIMNLL